MITPSFSLTATERVLPKMALDFTTASLDSRVTFTRSGNTATVVNSSGYVAPINANLPRFDYDPVTLACKGLLIEEARSNLRTYSEQFENIVWTKSEASVSANAITSPSNTTTADKLIESAANSAHFVFGQVIGLPITTYTWSVFAKAAGRDWIFLTEGNNITASAFFNLSTGTIGNVTGTGSPSAMITNFGNGWYRCTLTATIIAGVHNCQIRLSTGNGVGSYQGDGTSGVYLWGAQLEAGAFSTSYIPTELLAVTRNADLASMTGTNFSDWFNASQGTFNAKFIFSGLNTAAGSVPLSLDNGLANGYMFFRNSAGSAVFVFAGPNLVNLFVPSNNTLYNVIGSYNATAGTAAVNGSATSPLTTSGVPTPNQALIGRNHFGNQFSGWIQKINYWNLLVTPNEVRAFSK